MFPAARVFLPYWWLSLCLGLVLLSLRCSALGGLALPFFLFGRRPKKRSLSACDRGRHIPAPVREGRRVGSSGHRPKNRNFQVSPTPFSREVHALPRQVSCFPVPRCLQVRHPSVGPKRRWTVQGSTVRLRGTACTGIALFHLSFLVCGVHPFASLPSYGSSQTTVLNYFFNGPRAYRRRSLRNLVRREYMWKTLHRATRVSTPTVVDGFYIFHHGRCVPVVSNGWKTFGVLVMLVVAWTLLGTSRSCRTSLHPFFLWLPFSLRGDQRAINIVLVRCDGKGDLQEHIPADFHVVSLRAGDVTLPTLRPSHSADMLRHTPTVNPFRCSPASSPLR